LPRKINSQNFIKTCHSNCTFENVLEQQSACLGVYYNHSGEIFIKQLGIIYSDEQCLTLKQCILDIDILNSQSFSCCCSTDNCTLNWTSISIITTTTTTTYRSILIHKIINIEKNNFSWKLFLIIFLFIMIIILIIFTFVLWKLLRRNKHQNKDKKLLILKPSSSIEQLFYSAQQITAGKNSIIYKSIFDNNIVALKVYKKTNILIWKNEVTLLKSIKHESIIKFVKF
jgi:hypothetical protein